MVFLKLCSVLIVKSCLGLIALPVFQALLGEEKNAIYAFFPHVKTELIT